MRIGFDGNEANVKERVGINTYAFELLWALWKLQGEWGGVHSLIVYLKSPPSKDLPKETQNFKYKVIPGGGNWILKKLTPHLWFTGLKPDIFFSPSHYVSPFLPMSKVCSIMDLGYLEFSAQFQKKDFWQLKIWSAISIYVSKAIIAISESTAKDIVRHYPSVKSRIHVAHLAFDKEMFNEDISLKDVRRVKDKYSIVDDYILYLGTLKPSKNIDGLIESFGQIKSNNKKTKLVIAGKKGWLYQSIFDKVEKLNLKGKVIFTDFIEEGDKPALIKGAKIFALPSFWEGFGLDVLNAMAAGVPVVVSSAGSLPEVVGNAGIIVDPYNINSITQGLERILSADENEYNKFKKLGLERVKGFTWEKTARKVLQVLENK